MAKKTNPSATAPVAAPVKTPELGLEGAGVSPLAIPAIDKAVSKYERAKDKRCQASPGEIAAKQELSALLHQHRDELPRNEAGEHFYRHDGKDYILEEKLKCRKVDDGSGDED